MSRLPTVKKPWLTFVVLALNKTLYFLERQQTLKSDETWAAFCTNRCQREILPPLSQHWACAGAVRCLGLSWSSQLCCQAPAELGKDWEGGLGQLGLHRSPHRDDGSTWKKKEEQPGSLSAASTLGELIKETRRKLQSVESEVVGVWERKIVLLPMAELPGVPACSEQGLCRAEGFAGRVKAQQRREKKKRNSAEPWNTKATAVCSWGWDPIFPLLYTSPCINSWD